MSVTMPGDDDVISVGISSTGVIHLLAPHGVALCRSPRKVTALEVTGRSLKSKHVCQTCERLAGWWVRRPW